MKKILTASLVAMMAVTAANADIASTEYVNKAKQAAEATATGYNTAMNTRVTSLETDNTKNQGDITKLQADVAAIGGADGSISTQIAAAVQGLDVDTITVADGKYVKTVSETDGKVSVTTGDLVGQINENGESKNDTSTVAPTTAAVAGYVKNKLEVMTNDVDTRITNALSGTKQDVAGLKLDVANLETNSATKEELATQNTTLTGDIATAKSQAIEAAKGETTSQVSAAKTELQGQIDALNTGDNSVSTQIDNKIGTLANGATDVATAIANAQAAAATDAETKANTALADAKTYADQAEADAISTAATDATTKANKALADAKTYADQAEADAVSTAAADATTKANKALADAKSDAANTYQVKSSAMSIGAAGGAWTDLTTVTGYSATGTHSLVLKEGKIQWEKVVNE